MPPISRLVIALPIIAEAIRGRREDLAELAVRARRGPVINPRFKAAHPSRALGTGAPYAGQKEAAMPARTALVLSQNLQTLASALPTPKRINYPQG